MGFRVYSKGWFHAEKANGPHKSFATQIFMLDIMVLGLTWFVSPTACVRLFWTWNVDIETAAEDLAKVKEMEKTYFLVQFTVIFGIPLVAMTVLDTHLLLLIRRSKTVSIDKTQKVQSHQG